MSAMEPEIKFQPTEEKSKKEIALEKKMGRKKATSLKKYPSKTIINLAMRDVPKTNAKKRIPIFIACGVLLIVGLKFGVLDILLTTMKTEGEATQVEGELSQAQTLLMEYDAVEEEYQNYMLDKIGVNGSLVSTMESLGIIEKYLLSAAKVKDFSIQGNMITATLNITNLDTASEIYNSLISNEKVTDVRIYTAQRGEQNEVTVCNITIFLLSTPIAQEAGGGQ